MPLIIVLLGGKGKIIHVSGQEESTSVKFLVLLGYSQKCVDDVACMFPSVGSEKLWGR